MLPDAHPGHRSTTVASTNCPWSAENADFQLHAKRGKERKNIQWTPMWRQQFDPPAYWSALRATTRSVFWLGAPHAPSPPFG